MKPLIFNMAWPISLGLCALMGLACGWTDVAHAGSPVTVETATAPQTASEVAEWGAAASNSCLAAVRGGFDTGTGLLASFGIERAVYVNGNLITRTGLYIPNIGQMSAEQASALAAVTSTISVVQNGPGNTFDPASLAHSTGATVVQNSLNNQNIQALTTLNTTVNTLGMLKNLNLQSTLQAALINSLGH